MFERPPLSPPHPIAGAAVGAGRFATIDALRGVAAIAVMLFHLDTDAPLAMPGGYLAVDLFFALSGFVIAHSYAGRMDAGMGFGTFMRLRIARLWPMLALGAALGIVLHGGHAGMLFLLPNPLSPAMLYPANPPYWSLLLELAAYAGFALAWGQMGARGLAGVIIASAAILAFYASGPNKLLSFGAEWGVLLPGFARLGFAFGIGVAVYHWRKASPPRRTTALAWTLPVIFAAICALVGQANWPGLLAILFVVPALAWLATCWEVPQTRAAAILGDLSYPLYCIHLPLLAWAAGTGFAAAMLIVLPFAALWLDRRVDGPARRALKRLLLRETGAPPAGQPV
ncbi:MAG: acyltransferase [Alphaproteobacteria bacterium]|nr:acyltransferase [Alphaproteobacteria bacterium]